MASGNYRENEACPAWTAWIRGGIMEFKVHRKQFLLAGPLAAAVTAVTITACGGGSTPAFAQGSAPGHWTQTEISEFMAAGGSDGSDSTDSCIAGYFERDMSFGNAMAAGMASSGITSIPQVGTALGDRRDAR